MMKLLMIVPLLALGACGGGDSDSGAGDSDLGISVAGSMVPANLTGVYSGDIRGTATALGISLSGDYPITITVTNNIVRFDGDDPDETFTVGLRDDGTFSGVLNYDDDRCSGDVQVEGIVDGSNASGTFDGEGSCENDGTNINVSLEGDFTAAK